MAEAAAVDAHHLLGSGSRFLLPPVSDISMFSHASNVK